MTILNKIKAALIHFGKVMIEARQESANRQIAMMQLHGMTDKELSDIGIGRGDIRRVVNLEK